MLNNMEFNEFKDNEEVEVLNETEPSIEDNDPSTDPSTCLKSSSRNTTTADGDSTDSGAPSLSRLRQTPLAPNNRKRKLAKNLSSERKSCHHIWLRQLIFVMIQILSGGGRIIQKIFHVFKSSL